VFDICDTPSFKAWVQQFPEEDQGTAHVLARGLALVSPDELHGRLRGLISDRVEQLRIENEVPVALFPISKLRGNTEPFHTRSGTPRRRRRPGSEGAVATLVEQCCRALGTDCLNTPTIGQMRDARCRTVLCVDDIAGSGDRAMDFVNLLQAHPTVMSWLSWGYIRTEVVAYGVSQAAQARLLRATKCPVSVRYWRIPHFGPALGEPV